MADGIDCRVSVGGGGGSGLPTESEVLLLSGERRTPRYLRKCFTPGADRNAVRVMSFATGACRQRVNSSDVRRTMSLACGTPMKAAAEVSSERESPTRFKGARVRAWVANPRKAGAYEYSNQFRAVVLYLGLGLSRSFKRKDRDTNMLPGNACVLPPRTCARHGC